jgi:hypothetical protein
VALPYVLSHRSAGTSLRKRTSFQPPILSESERTTFYNDFVNVLIESKVFARNDRNQLAQTKARSVQISNGVKPNGVSLHILLEYIQ